MPPVLSGYIAISLDWLLGRQEKFGWFLHQRMVPKDLDMGVNRLPENME